MAVSYEYAWNKYLRALTDSLLLAGGYSLRIVSGAEVACNAIGQYEDQRRQPAEQLEPAHYDGILHKDLQRENR